MKPLVCIASRDRNIALDRALRSIYWTSSADVAVYLDDDQAGDYAGLVERLPQVRWMTGPRIGPCASLNALVEASPGYCAYGAATDDCEFLTEGWDRWVTETVKDMPGGVGLLSPKLIGSRRMDFPWASARWIEVVGYLAIPTSRHYYWDVALEVLGEQTHIARAGEDEFLISHDDAPSENLQVYAEKDAMQAIVWLAFDRPKLLRKLREAM